MTIDIERLQHDLDYWNKHAPEGATHYGPAGKFHFEAWFKNVSGGPAQVMLTSDSNRLWHSGLLMDAPLIPRPSPAWDGSGLPPVGVECEISTNGGAGFRVGCVDAYNRDKSAAMFDFCGIMDCASLDHCLFRPLKTEKERVVEVAAQVAGYGKDATIVPIVIGRLYDAGMLKEPTND